MVLCSAAASASIISCSSTNCSLFICPACSPASKSRSSAYKCFKPAIRCSANHHVAPALPTSAGSPSSTPYTSMRSDPLAFWESHKGLRIDGPQRPFSEELEDSRLDQDAGQALFLAAQLRLLATAASDRAEMHAILAQQRDNWNKLFQRMLTATCMTSCVLSALDGQTHSLSLALPAFLLNAGSAAMMAIINQFQPSQLAEEQRTAARLFRKLASDIHYELNIAPHLRQNTPSFLDDCQCRLEALDKAFPMPLTPGGLEKFPAKVVPPVLREPTASSCDVNVAPRAASSRPFSDSNTNGWDMHLTCELQKVADMLRRSDIPKYTGWAQNLVKVNKCFAFAAPLLAMSAAALNALAIGIPTAALPTALGMWAAICSVLSAFVGSFSNDMQLGMVFELYRNSAGYYADIEAAITKTLATPIEERENGTLFRQRVAYQLGRSPTTSAQAQSMCRVVPVDAREAGTLF